MAESSKIEWTDATWNPITGCTMVSAGCTNCYAMGLAAGPMRHHASRAGLTRSSGGRPVWTGEVRLNEEWIDLPIRWTRPRRVFVCAHGDLFHEAVPDEWIDRVFAVMALAPRHTFQVLTKRPERMQKYLRSRQAMVDGDDFLSSPFATATRKVSRAFGHPVWTNAPLSVSGWPLPNVWLGTSVEDQATADARIPHLLATPAAVRFISAEPLLGPLDVQFALAGWAESDNDTDTIRHPEVYDHVLDWVIVGGESGTGARPMHPDWARSLRDQCQAAGVQFFFKQWGGWAPAPDGPDTYEAHRARGAKDYLVWPNGSASELVGKSRAGRLLDGREWNEMPGASP